MPPQLPDTPTTQRLTPEKCYEFTSADNVYLAKVVGDPLKRCIKECIEKRPIDPIEWIAQWLYKSVDNQQYFHEKITFLKDMDEFEKEYDRQKRKTLRNIQNLKHKGMEMMMQYGVVIDMDKSPKGGSTAREEFSFIMPEKSDPSQQSGERGHGHGGHGGHGGQGHGHGGHGHGGSRRHLAGGGQMGGGPSEASVAYNPEEDFYVDEYGELILDAEGYPIRRRYDSEDNIVPILRDADGNFAPPTEGSLNRDFYTDVEGNMLMDKNGLPLRKRFDSQGHILLPTIDEDGHVIAPEGGKPKREFYADEDGRELVDKDGNPIEIKYDRHGKAIPLAHDQDGNFVAPQGGKPHRKKEMETATATWGVTCNLGLVCRHPILGDMEPRPPLVYPETPGWWERQEYIKETLYDHEVYSRPNNDPHPMWNKIEHMTWHEFIEPGPWISGNCTSNMTRSLLEMVGMPAGNFKHEHRMKEGDYFPDEKDIGTSAWKEKVENATKSKREKRDVTEQEQ